MSGLAMRNRRILRRAEALISKWRVLRGMRRRAIVGVDDVACRASARAIVAGLVIRSRKRKQGIEQSRFLQAEKYRVGAKLGAEYAIAKFIVWLSCIVRAHLLADFTLGSAAALEYAENVSGLRNFPAFERSDLGQHALTPDFFRARMWNCLDRLRRAV